MAKAKTVETPVAEATLTKVTSGTLVSGTQAPADLAASAGQGTEHLGAEDIRPPRLALAQAMSPQCKRGDSKSIDGLREGDLFNDLTEEVYGEGPLEVVIITCLGARGVLFAPMEEGGGIVEANLALDDPRMLFTSDEESGKRVKPVATKFYDYLAWLPEKEELMALSMKGTQLKTAIKLNSLLRYPLKVDGALLTNPPAWARTFLLGAAMTKKDAYSWAVFTLKAKGITPVATRELCASLHEQYAGKNIIIERETPEPENDAIPPAKGDGSFDPAKF